MMNVSRLDDHGDARTRAACRYLASSADPTLVERQLFCNVCLAPRAGNCTKGLRYLDGSDAESAIHPFDKRLQQYWENHELPLSHREAAFRQNAWVSDTQNGVLKYG